MQYIDKGADNKNFIIVQIILSFFIAFLLETVPITINGYHISPYWTLFFCIHWSFFNPNLFGLTWGWIIGILIDVLTRATIGVNASIFALSIYIILLMHRQLWMFSLYQQVVIIFIFVLFMGMLQALFQFGFTQIGYIDNFYPNLIFRSLSSSLLWIITYLIWYRNIPKQMF